MIHRCGGAIERGNVVDRDCFHPVLLTDWLPPDISIQFRKQRKVGEQEGKRVASTVGRRRQSPFCSGGHLTVAATVKHLLALKGMNSSVGSIQRGDKNKRTIRGGRTTTVCETQWRDTNGKRRAERPYGGRCSVSESGEKQRR